MSEVEWRVLQELLPPEHGRRGRPPLDRQATINGILSRLRSGAPWRDVPERFGNWNSIVRCFRRWCRNSAWAAVATTPAEIMADNRHHSIDSTTVRGHVSAAVAEGRLANKPFSARGAGSPIRFIVSGMPTADRPPSILQAEKRPTARLTKR